MTRGARGRTLTSGIVLDATAGINRAAAAHVRRYRDIEIIRCTGCISDICLSLGLGHDPLCLRTVISLCPRGARTSFDIDYRVPHVLPRLV